MKNLAETIHSRIDKGGAQIFVLQAIGMALLFIMNLVIARMVNVSEYGVYSFSILCAGLLAKVFSLGWPTALLRYVAQYVEQKKWPHLKGILIRAYQISLLSGMTVAAVLAIATVFPFIPDKLTDSLRLTALLVPCLIFTNVRQSIIRAFGYVKASIIPELIAQPLIIILLVLIVSVTHANSLVVIYAAVSWTIYFVAGYWLKQQLPPDLKGIQSHYRTAEWVSTALPMTLGGLGFLLINRTGVLLLGIMSDMNAVGLYAAANRVACLSASYWAAWRS
jgi:O-antigen/teichoic acid export membrane protein